MRTRYDVFNKLEELLQVVQTGEHCYNKMVISGDLRNVHYDYDRGFYDVSMYYLNSMGTHCCRVWFGTIDDGDFGSWNDFDNKEDAIKLLNKIVEKFKSIKVCPSLEELNKEFRDLGVYFINE